MTSGIAVAYEPIACLAHRLTAGAEAVAWWRPGEAIEHASDRWAFADPEDVRAVDRAVLARVMDDARTTPGPVSVTVNLGAQTIRTPGFAGMVASDLAWFELPPATLTFEVSEALALSDRSWTITVLDDLRAVGCGVGLDHFGGSVASFSLLRRLPVDYVKLDDNLVAQVLGDPAALTAIGAIVATAGERGIPTLAQGVSSDAQAAWLAELGCSLGQGPQIGAPVPWALEGCPHGCAAYDTIAS